MINIHELNNLYERTFKLSLKTIIPYDITILIQFFVFILYLFYLFCYLLTKIDFYITYHLLPF